MKINVSNIFKNDNGYFLNGFCGALTYPMTITNYFLGHYTTSERFVSVKTYFSIMIRTICLALRTNFVIYINFGAAKLNVGILTLSSHTANFRDTTADFRIRVHQNIF